MSTTSNAKRLKLIAATALGLDALTFFVSALVFLAVESFDWAIFVPFVVTGVLCFFSWEGLRSPGAAGGCLLPLAFVGLWFAFLGAAFSGASWPWFLLFLVLWSLIPLTAGILFLVARRIEGPGQQSTKRAESDDRTDLSELDDRVDLDRALAHFAKSIDARNVLTLGAHSQGVSKLTHGLLASEPLVVSHLPRA